MYLILDTDIFLREKDTDTDFSMIRMMLLIVVDQLLLCNFDMFIYVYILFSCYYKNIILDGIIICQLRSPFVRLLGCRLPVEQERLIRIAAHCLTTHARPWHP